MNVQTGRRKEITQWNYDFKHPIGWDCQWQFQPSWAVLAGGAVHSLRCCMQPHRIEVLTNTGGVWKKKWRRWASSMAFKSRSKDVFRQNKDFPGHELPQSLKFCNHEAPRPIPKNFQTYPQRIWNCKPRDHTQRTAGRQSFCNEATITDWPLLSLFSPDSAATKYLKFLTCHKNNGQDDSKSLLRPNLSEILLWDRMFELCTVAVSLCSSSCRSSNCPRATCWSLRLLCFLADQQIVNSKWSTANDQQQVINSN